MFEGNIRSARFNELVMQGLLENPHWLFIEGSWVCFTTHIEQEYDVRPTYH